MAATVMREKIDRSRERIRPEVTDELLAEITRRIVTTFRPREVILFGSHAWGKPHPDSDLDLFVVMEFSERPAVAMAKVHEVAEVPFLAMDVLVYAPDEVTERLQLGDSFIREIVSRGRKLYSHGNGR